MAGALADLCADQLGQPLLKAAGVVFEAAVAFAEVGIAGQQRLAADGACPGWAACGRSSAAVMTAARRSGWRWMNDRCTRARAGTDEMVISAAWARISARAWWTRCRAARIAVTACWICALSVSLRLSRSASIRRISARSWLICSSGGAACVRAQGSRSLAACRRSESAIGYSPLGDPAAFLEHLETGGAAAEPGRLPAAPAPGC
jgi:hypothetical protein